MGMMSRKVMAGASGISITSPNHPDLIAMYTMDNISGSTLVDESPNGNDGTIIGGVTTTTGVIGNALSFDGSTGYVNLNGVLIPATTFAISFWYTQSTTPRPSPDYYVSQYRAGVTGRTAVAYYDFDDTNIGDFFYNQQATPVQQKFDPTVHPATFSHAVLSCNAGAATVRVNDVDSGLSMTGVNIMQTVNTLLGAGFASDGVTPVNILNSDLDLVRFFNRPLTTTETAELYNGGAGA